MPKKFRNSKNDNKSLYSIYHGIKKRCYNENSPRYKDYGARGITMCDEWHDISVGFDNFCDWAKLNGYKEGLSIERKNVDGNYCPENCEWITILRQSYNKRTTVFIEFNGRRKCLRDWCNELELNYYTVQKRLKKGWSVEDAFRKPEKPLSEICREQGMNPQTVRDRIHKLGWTMEDALTIPENGYVRTDEMCEKLYGYTICPVCNKRFLKRNANARTCSIKCGDYYKHHKEKFS